MEPRTRRPNGFRLERRGSARYPVNLAVRYMVSNRRWPVKTGAGRTIDLSSSGLSFEAEKPLTTGLKLDLSTDWPVLLDGGIQLQLTMSGVVVRTSGTVVALRIRRHEFRTRSTGPGSAAG